MHEALLATRASEQLRGAVAEHFVEIHVRLSAGARLPHAERKFAVVLSRERFVRRRDDGVCLLRIERAQREIDLGRASLDDQQRANELWRHLLGGDAEVSERALRLGAPEVLGRHFDRAEAVALDARGGHLKSPDAVSVRAFSGELFYRG